LNERSNKLLPLFSEAMFLIHFVDRDCETWIFYALYRI